MQIERNLSVPLRSLVERERVSESSEQVSPGQTLVHRDRGQKKQQEQHSQSDENPEEKLPQQALSSSPEKESNHEAGQAAPKRLDLVV